MNKYIIVDVESDGPVPGLYSMVSFGAVEFDINANYNNRSTFNHFYGKTRPLHNANYNPKALAVSNTTREEHKNYPNISITMYEFDDWLAEISEEGKHKLIFVSDNPGFDFPWINYYFHNFLSVQNNPFGWSSRRIGDMFCGFYKKSNYFWKKHRTVKHTHHPVDDAAGNASALQYLVKQGFNLK